MNDKPQIRPADNIDETQVSTDFSGLDRDVLTRMEAAALEVIDVHSRLAKTSDNVVGELIKNAEAFYEWDHYPDGDVFDSETNSQFFYHAHPADLRVGEHGHFHTFLRPAGMPAGITPAPLADYEPPKDADDALSHIIGISMDSFGVPICLFTTNRWVTGEYWYAASDVVRMIDLFDISHTQPSWPVNRWVTGMVSLFRPQILTLLTARDETVAAWAKAGKSEDGNVYEDRNLEVTSYCLISIEDQVQAIDVALRAAD
jgi:hypothetical protein